MYGICRKLNLTVSQENFKNKITVFFRYLSIIRNNNKESKL